MIVQGNIHTDQRGSVRFVNDFNFDGVKRFYVIDHPDINVIRAWQGHRTETKHFFVAKGVFLINWIMIDNWKKPSSGLEIQSKTLTDRNSEILIIPPGHVNGFQALSSDSIIVVFSDKTLQESKEDDFRFPVDYWKFQQ
jgi:dTDP-4-dehydrorhamnose 3,5-epimerase-like enzyme